MRDYELVLSDSRHVIYDGNDATHAADRYMQSRPGSVVVKVRRHYQPEVIAVDISKIRILESGDKGWKRQPGE